MIQSFRRDNRRGGSRGYGYSCWAVLLGFGSLARPPPSLNPLSFGSEGRSSTLILSSLWASERERERNEGRKGEEDIWSPANFTLCGCLSLSACLHPSLAHGTFGFWDCQWRTNDSSDFLKCYHLPAMYVDCSADPSVIVITSITPMTSKIVMMNGKYPIF